MNLTAERSKKMIEMLEPILAGKTLSDKEVMRRVGAVSVLALYNKSTMEFIGSKATNPVFEDTLLEAA